MQTQQQVTHVDEVRVSVGSAPPPRPVVQMPLDTCRTCGGAMVETFTTCGMLMAICCFPIGIICCLAMKDRHCDRCGQVPS